MTDVEIHPLTPDRWADLEDLFGPNGAGGGCWCMLWRVRRKDWEAGKGDGNRDALAGRVQAGPPPGVLAYRDGVAVGWCSAAPRAELPGLATSRVLAPVDDAPVWSVTCFFSRRGHRRQGLSVPLLHAAADLARSHGATILEGYPIDPTTPKYSASFAWNGFAGTFRAAGFQEVARRSETRPVMRLTL